MDLCWRRGLALPERHHSQVAVARAPFTTTFQIPRLQGMWLHVWSQDCRFRENARATVFNNKNSVQVREGSNRGGKVADKLCKHRGHCIRCVVNAADVILFQKMASGKDFAELNRLANTALLMWEWVVSRGTAE